VRRWLCNPVATLVFAVMFYLAVTGDGAAIFSEMPPGGPRHASGAPDACLASVVRVQGRLRVVPVDDPLTARGFTGQVWYAYRRREGDASTLAATRETQGVVVAGGLNHKECDEVRALYIAYLGAQSDPFWQRVGAELGASTGGVTVRGGPRYQFFLQALWFVLLAGSSVWMIGAARWMGSRVGRLAQPPLTPQEKRWRALSQGKCPTCAYSIAGLREHKCPECGEKWHVMEMTAWARRGRR
jgi:hypothetical protein